MLPLGDAGTAVALGGVFAYSGGAQVNVDAINAAPVKAVDESSAGDAMVRNAAGQPPRDAPRKPSPCVSSAPRPALME